MTIPTEVAAVLADARMKVKTCRADSTDFALYEVEELCDALESALTKAEAVEWQWREDSEHDGTYSTGWMNCSREDYEARMAVLAGRDSARMCGPNSMGPIREDAGGWPVQVRALYAEPVASVPDGWVLVPIQYTKFMMDAAIRPGSQDQTGRREAAIWNAMIAAAPQPPTTQQGAAP